MNWLFGSNITFVVVVIKFLRGDSVGAKIFTSQALILKLDSK
jgi:hypothetical protein